MPVLRVCWRRASPVAAGDANKHAAYHARAHATMIRVVIMVRQTLCCTRKTTTCLSKRRAALRRSSRFLCLCLCDCGSGTCNASSARQALRPCSRRWRLSTCVSHHISCSLVPSREHAHRLPKTRRWMSSRTRVRTTIRRSRRKALPREAVAAAAVKDVPRSPQALLLTVCPCEYACVHVLCTKSACMCVPVRMHVRACARMRAYLFSAWHAGILCPHTPKSLRMSPRGPLSHVAMPMGARTCLVHHAHASWMGMLAVICV